MASQPPSDIPQGPVDDPVPTPVDPVPPTPTDPVVGTSDAYPEVGSEPLIEGP